MKAPLLTFSLAAGLIMGQGASAQVQPPQEAPRLLAASQPAPRLVAASEPAPLPLLRGELVLEPRQLAQLVAVRNPEIRYSRLGVDVAAHLSEAEASLYEAVFFGVLRGDDRTRQRTVEERISSVPTLAVLDERAATLEYGVRQRLPTAGEFAVSYRIVRRSNNIIASSTSNRQDTEYVSGLVLSLKQPLWRNAGRGVLETDRRIAELEHRIQWVQFRQQVLKSTADALNLYWQLYRAQEARRLREESLANVRRMAQEVDGRVEAGRAPPANRIEIRSTVLARESEMLRAAQAAREAESRVLTALGLSGAGHPDLRLRAASGTLPAEPPPADLQQSDLQRALDRALAQWPPYLLSQLRLEQARLRLEYADNQRNPALDLSFAYTGTGLSYSRVEARRLAHNDRYPEWSVALSLEMPLGGNGRADGQYDAQAVRVRQGQLEQEAIRTSLWNDLLQRHDDLHAALQLVGQMRQDLALRQTLLEGARERYNMGLGQLSHWLERENEVLETRQRLAEALMRAQLARVAWQFAQGGLLDDYDIALRNE